MSDGRLRSASPRPTAAELRKVLFACCSPEPALVRALEKRSIHVATVCHAGEIEALLAQSRPACVVLDLDAPQAEEVALCLPEGPARRESIVLLASGPSVFLAMKCLASRRADHVLMKPADREELATVLGEPGSSTGTRLPSLERIQWEYIHAVLGSCDGNVSAAARQLGMYRQSLQRMLRRHPPSR